MSLQWTAVAGFLYVELALTLLLILPLLKPAIWKWIFSWSMFSRIQPIWTTVYYAVLLILVILFIDSIRIQMKYGSDSTSLTDTTLDKEINRKLNTCRGQRNFYITGFALFLILVIKRLITMLSQAAQLEASHSAALTQARNANAELTRRIEREASEQPAGGDKAGKDKAPGPSKEEYAALKKECERAKTDLDTLKKQAEATNAEYDRVAEEHQKLLQSIEKDKDGKKDQ